MQRDGQRRPRPGTRRPPGLEGFGVRGHLRGKSVFECEQCRAFFFQPFSFPRKRPKEAVAIPEEAQAVMRAHYEDEMFEFNGRRADAGIRESFERKNEQRRAAGEAAGKVPCPECGDYVKPAGLDQHTAARHPS